MPLLPVLDCLSVLAGLETDCGEATPQGRSPANGEPAALRREKRMAHSLLELTHLMVCATELMVDERRVVFPQLLRQQCGQCRYGLFVHACHLVASTQPDCLAMAHSHRMVRRGKAPRTLESLHGIATRRQYRKREGAHSIRIAACSRASFVVCATHAPDRTQGISVGRCKPIRLFHRPKTAHQPTRAPGSYSRQCGRDMSRATPYRLP